MSNNRENKHKNEVKVRLDDEDYAFICQLSNRTGEPRAVIVRRYAKRCIQKHISNLAPPGKEIRSPS